jgi:hypothetical protein
MNLALFLAVDDRHSRFAGKPEDLHLGAIDVAQRAGTVNHIDDAGTTGEWGEEFPVIAELRVYRCLLPKGGDWIGGVSAEFSQLAEDPSRVLKTRGVGEPEQFPAVNDYRKGSALRGFSRGGADPYRIIFGEGGEDG